MATAERKARKRNGEKFKRKIKIGTPLERRALRSKNMEHVDQFNPLSNNTSNKHRRRIQEAIQIRDMDPPKESIDYITSQPEYFETEEAVSNPVRKD